MTWKDRVVRTTDGEEESFAIYEVYYDDDGCPEARTEEPVHPAGETVEELAEDLLYYQAAVREPVLDDAVFHRPTAELFEADVP
jgi:hypothetical protein